jgi:hypothetical protein
MQSSTRTAENDECHKTTAVLRFVKMPSYTRQHRQSELGGLQTRSRNKKSPVAIIRFKYYLVQHVSEQSIELPSTSTNSVSCVWNCLLTHVAIAVIYSNTTRLERLRNTATPHQRRSRQPPGSAQEHIYSCWWLGRYFMSGALLARTAANTNTRVGSTAFAGTYQLNWRFNWSVI